MKILFVIGIVALIVFSIWYAKRKELETKSKSNTIKTNLDEPIGFGYKICWIAVKTDKKEELAEILKLKNTQPANWESGMENAYDKGVFITPQI
ncbi:hypothetical protein [uncultured Aquimarina sp.]|uniref:hypothetical protein n=1 Tax=uncultured Aquimarina sp. TaxID=575652 RepID=UPI0026133248|nr:hypothetical protein [uncultured Aquimarina sp.]